MEIIKTVRDGLSEVTNHIKIDGGSYTHKQIEKINGKVYMRIKSRKIYEIVNPLNFKDAGLKATKFR